MLGLRIRSFAAGVFLLTLLCAGTGRCAIIRVSTTGEDSPAHDGSTWALAKQTVQAGIDAASSGDEVWVAAGNYGSAWGGIVLKDGLGLYGGFIGTETARSERPFPPASNPSTLSSGSGDAVTIAAGSSSSTVLDGFNISGTLGIGVVCTNASPTIRYNTIGPNDNGGVYCGSGSPTIVGNTIKNNYNHYQSGGGIHCAGGSPTIVGNTVENNSAWGDGGGIYCEGGTVERNVITGNTVTYTSSLGSALGGGLCSSGSTVAGNYVAHNAATCYGGAAVGGLYCSGGSAIGNVIVYNAANAAHGGAACGGLLASGDVLFNTVAGNSAIGGVGDAGVGGISCSGGTAANNIVWNNSGQGGAGSCGGMYAAVGTTLNNNNAYGNIIGGDCAGASPGLGDISAAPEFVDSANGDWRLKDSSPCIDSGLDTVVQPGWLDMDGHARIYGEHVDIGAYEFTGSRKVTAPRFSPAGGTYNPMPLITVTCARAGAVVHGTTDGTEPTPDSPVIAGSVFPTSSPFEIRAIAVKDGYADSEIVAAVYTLDSNLPASRLAINDGNPYTVSRFVRLAQWSTESSVVYAQMRFSNDGAVWSEWEAFATSKYWALTDSDGSKTVSVQFKDAGGNISPSYSDSIVLDTSPPVMSSVTDDGIYTVDSGSLHATWTAHDDVSGVAEYEYAIGKSSSELVVGWKSAGTSVSVVESGLALQTNQSYKWFVRARNGAGLWSSVGISNGITVAANKTIGEAKAMVNGSAVQIDDARVISSPSDHAGFWVECADRSAGMRVDASPSVTRGQRLDVAGLVSWLDGVPRLTAVELKNAYDQADFRAPFFTTRALANDLDESLAYKGINPVGLLATILGRVHRVDTANLVFYVNDGANLTDGMGPSYDPFIGLRVSYKSTIAPPAQNKNVRVTGIRTVEKVVLQYGAFVNGQYRFPGETLYLPVLKVRDQADIKVY